MIDGPEPCNVAGVDRESPIRLVSKAVEKRQRGAPAYCRRGHSVEITRPNCRWAASLDPNPSARSATAARE